MQIRMEIELFPYRSDRFLSDYWRLCLYPKYSMANIILFFQPSLRFHHVHKSRMEGYTARQTNKTHFVHYFRNYCIHNILCFPLFPLSLALLATYPSHFIPNTSFNPCICCKTWKKYCEWRGQTTHNSVLTQLFSKKDAIFFSQLVPLLVESLPLWYYVCVPILFHSWSAWSQHGSIPKFWFFSHNRIDD